MQATANFETPFTIKLFSFGQSASGGTESVGAGGIIRMAEYQHRNGNILLQDFIPVRVGNKGYLYDRISGQLYGSETEYPFAAGPDKQQ